MSYCEICRKNQGYLATNCYLDVGTIVYVALLQGNTNVFLDLQLQFNTNEIKNLLNTKDNATAFIRTGIHKVFEN